MTREPRTTEEAVEIFLELRRRGQHVDGLEFAARHTHLGPELAEAIETLQLLENAGSASSPMDMELPDRLGTFRIVREVGRGGMGIVFESIEEPLGRRVALKVLPAEMLSSAAARARFRREAELAARLDHSGIATVFGTGIEANRPWIAMRFVEGRTLSKSITAARDEGRACVNLSPSNTSGANSVVELATCLSRVARALQAAHEQGVVHRDVKPSNIIVGPDGTPVLVDFGLAIPEDSDGLTVTRTGETAGTPAYIAPEIVGGSRARPDAQVDVYALGVTLYECLTLHRPFEGPTPVALYRSILSDMPVDARVHNPDVPTDLAVVVATAMERDRSRRYASAAALATDLEAVVAGLPIAARPLSTHERVVRWARREPKQAALVGVLSAVSVALALFAGNWWATRGEVHAAEIVARERECEAALTEGFTELQAVGTSARAFDRALALDPENLEAVAGLALSALSRDRTDRAREVLARAPDTLGFAALRNRVERRAVTQDRELLDSGRAAYLDYFLTGMALTLEANGLGHSDKPRARLRALTMMNEAIVRSPRAREFVHIQRATLAREIGDAAMSRSAAGSLLSLWPESYESVCTAGIALSDFDPISARSHLERAAALRPREAAPLQNLGMIAFQAGDFEDAETMAWSTMQRTDRPEGMMLLGNTYAARECRDEARSVFRSLLRRHPDHEDALLSDGQVALQAEDLESAAQRFEQLLRRDPWNGNAHAYLGIVLRLQEQNDAALVHLNAAASLLPNRPDVWAELVWLEGLLGDWASAYDCVQAGLERSPGAPALLEFKARIERIRAQRGK